MSNIATQTAPHELAAIETAAKPRIQAIEAAAAQLVVRDKASAADAGRMLRHIAETRRTIAEEFEPTIRAARAAHRNAIAIRDKVVAPFDAADKIARGKLTAYQAEEARKAREEAERLQAEENERRRREWEAEQERVRAENLEREKERQRALAEAKKAKDAEAVAALKAQPVAVELPPPPPPPAYIPPKPVEAVKGFSTRVTYVCEVVDAAAVPRAYLIPDQKALDALAKAQGERMNVPGCRAVPKTSTAVRM